MSDGNNAALIIIDMQNDYCHDDGALGKIGRDVSAGQAMVPNLQRLLSFLRKQHIPVIFVRTIHEPCTDSLTWKRRIQGERHVDICRKDTWGSEFYGVEPLEDDIVVVKHRYSAFVHTRLESVLRAFRIDTLIMTGVSTNVCVESTARDGFMNDYHIQFLSDCTAAFSAEEHEMSLRNIDQFFGEVLTSRELMNRYGDQKKKISVRVKTEKEAVQP